MDKKNETKLLISLAVMIDLPPPYKSQTKKIEITRKTTIQNENEKERTTSKLIDKIVLF